MDDGVGPFAKTKKDNSFDTYQPTKGAEFVYLLCLYLQSPYTLQQVLGVTDTVVTLLKIIQCSLLHLENIKKLISIGVAQKLRTSGNPSIPNHAEIAKANEIYLRWCFDGFHHFVWVIGLSMTSFLTCFRFLSPHTASPLLNLQIREVLFHLFGDLAGDSRSKSRKNVNLASSNPSAITPAARFMDEKLLVQNVNIARKTRDELLQRGLLKLIKGTG